MRVIYDQTDLLTENGHICGSDVTQIFACYCIRKIRPEMKRRMCQSSIPAVKFYVRARRRSLNVYVSAVFC